MPHFLFFCHFSVRVCILLSLVIIPVIDLIFRKPSLYWTLSWTPQTTCISERDNLLGAGIINTATDFIVVILPMPTVWKLKLPLQQQIIVMTLFSAGFVVICAGAVRTYYLYQVTIGWDKTWTAFTAWVASSVELYVGIVSLPPTTSNAFLTTQICASLPATKQFFNRYVLKLLGSSLLSHARASTRLSNFMMSSNRRSVPLDNDFELGMQSPKSPKFTPTNTNKDSPRVTVADWSSSHLTMVSSLKVDDERALTPSSFRTIGPDGSHTLQSMDSKDELLPSPTRSRPDHGNYPLQSMDSRNELMPTPTRSRPGYGSHPLQSMESKDELVPMPTMPQFDDDESFI